MAPASFDWAPLGLFVEALGRRPHGAVPVGTWMATSSRVTVTSTARIGGGRRGGELFLDLGIVGEEQVGLPVRCGRLGSELGSTACSCCSRCRTHSPS